MQVFQSFEYLLDQLSQFSRLKYFLHNIFLLGYVLLQVPTVHVFEDNVELADLFILLRDEVQVLHDVRMSQVLRYVEFFEHVLEDLISYIEVVHDLLGLGDKDLRWRLIKWTTQVAGVDICLGATTYELELGDFHRFVTFHVLF